MGEYLTRHASAGDLGSLTATFFVLLALTGLALISTWLAFKDVREHKLPGTVVRPAWAASAVLFGSAAVLSGEPSRLLGMAGGAVVLWLLYYLLRRVSRGALGRGDVRLAGMLGTVLGFASPWHVLWATVLGFVVGGLYAVFLLISRRAGAADRVPFGPAMLAGTALSLVLV
ncbi:prepilin peptidase [Kocuria coralli]|uniref:Prepilin peptidase n=1 Tax=Kocuria coralli TaxID=1461025 RepID=A0A5J5KY86_9MICC|nr:A24 family peptidase [Kocuria coralli]KAA9394614.1 prepilin peptidase [Kocuria coralli]